MSRSYAGGRQSGVRLTVIDSPAAQVSQLDAKPPKRPLAPNGPLAQALGWRAANARDPGHEAGLPPDAIGAFAEQALVRPGEPNGWRTIAVLRKGEMLAVLAVYRRLRAPRCFRTARRRAPNRRLGSVADRYVLFFSQSSAAERSGRRKTIGRISRERLIAFMGFCFGLFRRTAGGYRRLTNSARARS
jgi:hypothetical protein